MEWVLKANNILWIQANFIDYSEAILMQDRVACHMSNLIQNRSGNNNNFGSKYLRPPGSPDLNVLDFSIWANLYSKINDSKHHNTYALRVTITKILKGLL